MLTLRTIYSKIIQAGIYLAPSIKVAEAAKVIENTQRDLNIAFVNELSIIFNKLKIDTSEVLKAAETKWNFHNYKPGLVGGHCIGVDPYYLTYKSKKIGINPKVILAGRVINNSIPNFIINEIENKLKKKGKNLLNLKTLIFGLTFKNDCPDTRNSQVFKIINLLLKKNNKIDVYDPWVKNNNNYKKFNLVSELKVKSQYDIIIIAVNHHQFKKLGIKKIRSLMKKNGILFDVKNIFNKKESDLSL
jgi:UDP-N-acetyl-D-galactosamine dehydrogenase